ncbi:MAG: hypothetical protein ACR2L2_18475, partial [Acidobacteriota bacterium]
MSFAKYSTPGEDQLRIAECSGAAAAVRCHRYWILMACLLLFSSCNRTSKQQHAELAVDSATAARILVRAALDPQTWSRIRSRSVSNDLLSQLRTTARRDLTAEISAQIRDTSEVDWKTLSSSSLAILMPWLERPDSPLIPELAANPSLIRAKEIAQPFLTAKDLHGLASRAAQLLQDPASGSAELGMVVLSFANSLSADRRLDAALCHIVGKRLSYEELVVLPWSVLVSIDLHLSHPEVRDDGPHKRCQRARERIDAAMGAAPLNDFFEVRKNTFRSASSMLIHAGRDPEKLASMGLD